IIKLFGAAYLLYLAFMVFKSESDLHLNNKNIPKKTGLQLFKQGFLMNVLNPKVSLFFLALFPGFLFSTSLNEITKCYVFRFLFMTISIIIYSIIAILVSFISN